MIDKKPEISLVRAAARVGLLLAACAVAWVSALGAAVFAVSAYRAACVVLGWVLR